MRNEKSKELYYINDRANNRGDQLTHAQVPAIRLHLVWNLRVVPDFGGRWPGGALGKNKNYAY